VHAIAVAVVHDPPHGAAPAPVQVALVPCGCPEPTCVQAPTLPGTSHAWHCPAQAELQQVPSTQFVLVHSLPAMHPSPFAFVARHAPPLQ
jgi:hypothetical protein